jgi:hypothetical protein
MKALRTMSKEDIREHIYVTGQALLMVIQFVGIFVYGIAMIVAAFFPHHFRQKTAEDHAREAEQHQQKQQKLNEEFMSKKAQVEKERENEKEDELRRRNAWLDEKATSDEDAASATRDFWNTYEKRRVELNQMAVEPVVDLHNAVLEDDHRVKEINNVLKGVENGTEDPNKLRQLTDSLVKERDELVARDRQKKGLAQQATSKHQRYVSLFQKGERLLAQAHSAIRNRNWEAAKDLISEYDANKPEIENAYYEYINLHKEYCSV